MINLLRKLLAPKWVRRNGADDEDLPTVEGWYRVMVSGDSESCDGYTIYEYGDYEQWAYFTPNKDGGNFVGDGDEDNYIIFAWCGPLSWRPYVAEI